MKKHLLLIVTLGIFSLANAIELPIEQKFSITIENGEFTVFKFPFQIKKTFSSGFLMNKKVDEIKKLKEEENKIVIDPRTNQQRVEKKKIIQIKQGKKSITFLPKARGQFNIVVWGYKKYPLMFDIKVIDKLEDKKKQLESFYQFIDYSEAEEKAAKFETDPHEKVIVKLIRSIYNKKLPSGYKAETNTKSYSDGILEYTLNFKYTGKRYVVEEWVLKNLTNKSIKLYEEMFQKTGIFAISFENNILDKHSMTRMFIVKKANRRL